MSLPGYTLDKPVQFLTFNLFPSLMGILYQPQVVWGLLQTLISGAPRLLTEVDVLASMIKLGRNRTLQTLSKEQDILMTPFSLLDV